MAIFFIFGTNLLNLHFSTLLMLFIIRERSLFNGEGEGEGY